MARKRNLDAATQRYWEEFRRCRAELARELRMEQGLTQSELAKKAEVSLIWLKKMEENRLPRHYRMEKELQVISALGFGTFEIKVFYGRVGDKVEATVGRAPWLKKERRQNDE
jgi:transcriptional regulator with XRE-family HTH domain